jgi:type I restriction enzyme S subunit
MKAEGTTIGVLLKPRREKAIPAECPDLPYIGLEHVEAHTTRLLGSVPATEMKSTANRFCSGDVLYSRLRPYLNKVWHADRDGLCSSEFIVLPGNESVDANFLRYRLNSADFVSFANSLNAGDRPRVDFDQISSFILPPFSLSQQRRIVAEIEKQFTRLEAGVSALKRVQANLKRYRAAVLKAACEGKLVPTEAALARAGGQRSEVGGQKGFETGGQLLKRILTERRNNWQGRGQYKEPAAPDTANLPPLPEGWTWGTSSQVLREVKDGTHDTPAYHPTGIPFITQKHVKPNGLVFDDYKFISKEDHDNFYQRSNPERGDILVSMIGVNRGESCLINNNEVFSIKNVGLFKPHHSLSHAKFIQYYLSSRLGQQLILKQSKGGAQPFIGLTELRSWPIPLPPLAEQTRIVAEVERRLSVVEELEATVSANLQRAGRLRQAVLQKAFSGELC